MLRKKVINKLVVNWAASFLSVLLLMSMVALPALAAVASNSVNSSSIIDGAVRTRDIKRNAINSSRIRNYSIRKEDIHSGSINKYKLTSNSVNTYKIQDGTIKNVDISGSAGIADSKINYSTKTGYLSIPPSAFIPNKLINTYEHNAGFFLYSTASGTRRFYAPVHLPEGAKITKVTFETRDNSASYKLSWKLERRYTSGGTPTLGTMATAGTTNASQASPWQQLTDTSILNNVVDNSSNSYFVEAMFNGSTTSLVRAGRVLIEYTYTSPGS